jgi:hypothetical protein
VRLRTVNDTIIAYGTRGATGMRMSDRAGRWVTEQVGAMPGV